MGTSWHTPIRHTLGTLLLILALGGCTAPPSAPPPATATPAPQKTSLADICTKLVAYWAKEALKGGKWAGLDWEQKGLSNEQYDLHEEVVAAARAEERRLGRRAALTLIDARTRQECRALNGATGSSENWRPPG
ncbi:hypothetical protein ACIBCM_03065 [Streptomyces sp. NPDC051018]|uniref:hypothetical protein n=1 Tax=Streptomyces sp. NPDC051018 TaxID=3365639 RepID=UPI0037B6EA06